MLDSAVASRRLACGLTCTSPRGTPVSLDKEEVRTIAHLARLSVEEERLEPIAAELSRVLDFVDRLNSVDTSNIEPMANPVSSELLLRDDVVTETDEREQLQKPAPAVHQGYFTVPRVIE